MYLTKTDFVKGYQICPSYFWLLKHKPEVVPLDDEEVIKHRFEQGNEIERYARKLFPDAILVESKGAMAKTYTNSLVSEGIKQIFQATAITDTGLLAMADVLVFDESVDSWTLYEVKSTNSIKKEHIYDVAFQKAAFILAGYDIGSVKIIYLNKEYSRKTTIDPTELLVEEDVTEETDKYTADVKSQISDALNVMNDTTEPKGCSCRLRSRSGHCPTFQYLNPDVPEYSVFNIARIGKKNLALLVDGEIFNVNEVPDDVKLSVIQRNQVEVAKSKQPIINHKAIREFLSELEYPLYFLDYETVSTALPMFLSCHPYQQIPFQYSLHVLDRKDGELEHYEYLSRSATTLPAEELMTKLAREIGATGSVITWNKSFEKGRNTEMAKQYPDFSELMEGINDRIFDLMEVFSKQHYVHHKFKGSHSIKKVLPVLVEDFSYDDLEIQNGQAAALSWYEAVNSELEEESQSTFNHLLEYCKLDTLAMVKIYERLNCL